MAMNRRVWILALFLAVFTAAGSARTAPLRPEQVGAEADWVLHLDLEQPGKDGVLRALLHLPAVKESQASRTMGLDLENGLLSLTAYGKLDAAGNGVVLLRANMKQEEFEREARAAAGYREEMHGRHKIFLLVSAPAEGKGRWVCFAEKNLLLAGTTIEEVRRGLDVLDGKAPRLDKEAAARKWCRMPEGGCTFLLALNPKARREALDGDPSAASVWQKLSGCTLVVDEKNGRINASLFLGTDSAEQAGLVAKIVQGMLAMAQMAMDPAGGGASAAGERELEAWRQCRECMGRVQAVGEGNLVSVKISLPSEAVLTILKASLTEAPAEAETKHGKP